MYVHTCTCTYATMDKKLSHFDQMPTLMFAVHLCVVKESTIYLVSRGNDLPGYQNILINLLYKMAVYSTHEIIRTYYSTDKY